MSHGIGERVWKRVEPNRHVLESLIRYSRIRVKDCVSAKGSPGSLTVTIYITIRSFPISSRCHLTSTATEEKFPTMTEALPLRDDNQPKPHAGTPTTTTTTPHPIPKKKDVILGPDGKP
jgi:hypothetical protein